MGMIIPFCGNDIHILLGGWARGQCWRSCAWKCSLIPRRCCSTSMDHVETSNELNARNTGWFSIAEISPEELSRASTSGCTPLVAYYHQVCPKAGSPHRDKSRQRRLSSRFRYSPGLRPYQSHRWLSLRRFAKPASCFAMFWMKVAHTSNQLGIAFPNNDQFSIKKGIMS